ncbi:hypothetical protein MJO29_003234 [Puccinia striiformis f. sp. tritici]|nr:hypothetical protein MJO29_003234 [Puccinia striiformis f. sp. tritici]
MAQHLRLLKAEYAYSPQTEDEIGLEEEMCYYLLDDSDPDWSKVKLKASPTSLDNPPSGLVPANYLLPAEPLHQVAALYAYEAQTEDELTIQEDEILHLYEQDGDWSLVGRLSEESDQRGVGYVPTTYIETTQDNQHVDRSVEPVVAEIAQQPVLGSQTSNQRTYPDSGLATWAVTDIDHKKKKRKGTLMIDGSSFIFASESDKLGVQKYDMASVSITKTEKGKHLILQCGTEERHFQVSEKDLDAIVLKIQRFQQHVQPIPTSSPPRSKTNNGLAVLQSPVNRPPSAMANPDKPSGVSCRKVSFAAPLGKPATALYDFEAQGEDELTVEEGDRLFVLDDRSDDDWWKCAMQSDGQEGVVPASYIELDQGEPSGNQEAAEAAMTAAAAQSAKKFRIQEEEDARLAQELADQDRSETQLENLRLADRNLTIAREAEQRKNVEADLAARRKKESESRKREAERALSNPGLSNGPTPPKLVTRPDSAQGMSDHHHGTTPAPPKRPDSAPRDGKSKPQGLVRTWRDRTGQFKVEAEFRGLQNGKIRLHKVNGVTIEVPLSKMSPEDVIWLEGATGRTLRTQDSSDDIPLATLAIQNNSVHRSNTTSRPTPSQAPRRPSTKQPTIDWFEFFLNAGCDLDDCTRYSTNFERDRIDENLLADLEPSTMRNLGLREGDVIRVSKHIKSKYGPTDDGNSIKTQIQKDEELARKLQQQQDLGTTEPPNIFTNGPNGSLKNTRRGRPVPTRTGSSSNTVDINSITNKLVDTSSSSQPEVVEPSSPIIDGLDSSLISLNPLAKTGGGFDDDAWQVRPNSTTPVPPPTTTSTNPPAPPPPPPTGPTTTAEAPSKPSLNDEIFEKIMNHSQNNQLNQSHSLNLQSNQTASVPSSVIVPQATGFNPNGPRGPLAPVASNAPLLNPLVPLNSGMNGFVPTRPNTNGIQAQPTGFNVSAGYAPTTANPMMMQPTGMVLNGGMGMGGLNSNQLIQSQPTGMSPFGVIQSQPTGMMAQPTGMMSSMGTMQPQMTGFNPGYSSVLNPPVPNLPPMYSNPPQQQQATKSFNPSDIFGQMKTGQFAQNSLSTGPAAPQDPNKYNALRAQPTGFGTNGGNFTQQFMPNNNNIQQQQQQQQQQSGMMMVQPLTAQPTGFAPGGYLINQQTGHIPPNQNQPFLNNQQNQQWRGY